MNLSTMEFVKITGQGFQLIPQGNLLKSENNGNDTVPAILNEIQTILIESRTHLLEFRPIANEFVQNFIELCSRFWSKLGPGTLLGYPRPSKECSGTAWGVSGAPQEGPESGNLPKI